MPIQTKVIDHVYKKYDTDGDGTLSEKEAEVFLNEILQKLGHSKLSHMRFKGIFKYFDKDGNGTISKHEIGNIVAKVIPGV